MSDRSTAQLFGIIFDLLAENPTDEHKKIAQTIYKMASNYDFNDYQMYADESCYLLGIAKKKMTMGSPVYFFPSDEEFDQLY